MHQIAIGFLQEMDCQAAIKDLSLSMNKLERHTLCFTPWPAYSYKPDVEFSIAYAHDCILLKYFVTEISIRAVEEKINGPVWNDSCVEFFIAFDDKGYYNFEFNCVGTALVGFGTDRSNRELLAEELIREIRYISQINAQINGVHWELTIILPFTVFEHHHLTSLQGKTCKANFYKCGDLLPEPHYLSWSNIQTSLPDFHQPRFFGEVFFMPAA